MAKLIAYGYTQVRKNGATVNVGPNEIIDLDVSAGDTYSQKAFRVLVPDEDTGDAGGEGEFDVATASKAQLLLFAKDNGFELPEECYKQKCKVDVIREALIELLEIRGNDINNSTDGKGAGETGGDKNGQEDS